MAVKKVSVEVGHGGADSGAVCGKVLEKDINLVVALELKRQLERHKIEVLISREKDVNDKAVDFYYKAASFKPDAHISVHTNAFNGSAKGFEIYRNSNEYRTASNLLCAYIEAEVKALGQASRGVKDSKFLMSSLSCPTAYCELGFLDNPNDYKNFDTAEKQRAFGAAYAKGILEYFGVEYVLENPTGLNSNSGSGNGVASPTINGGADSSSASVSLSGNMYRVVAGSFANKDNAEAWAKKLKATGVECYIKVDS